MIGLMQKIGENEQVEQPENDFQDIEYRMMMKIAAGNATAIHDQEGKKVGYRVYDELTDRWCFMMDGGPHYGIPCVDAEVIKENEGQVWLSFE